MLRKYFEEFMADVPEQLPQLIHKSWMKKPIIYDEYILLEFNFPQAFSLEDIMKRIEDDAFVEGLLKHRETIVKHYF